MPLFRPFCVYDCELYSECNFWAHVTHSLHCLFVHCIYVYAGHAQNIQKKSHNRNTQTRCDERMMEHEVSHQLCIKVAATIQSAGYEEFTPTLSHILIHNFVGMVIHRAWHHTQLYKYTTSTHSFTLLARGSLYFSINKWLIFSHKVPNTHIHVHGEKNECWNKIKSVAWHKLNANDPDTIS